MRQFRQFAILAALAAILMTGCAGQIGTVQGTGQGNVGVPTLSYEAGYPGNQGNTGKVYQRPDGDYATWLGSSLILTLPADGRNLIAYGPGNESGAPWCYFEGGSTYPLRPKVAGWYRIRVVGYDNSVGPQVWILVYDPANTSLVPPKPAAP